MPASVSAIIVAYGDPDAARACVAALQAQTRPPRDIVVVDNHRSAGTHEALYGTPGVTLLPPRGNTGYTGGCARGAEHAAGEYLLFINPDAVPAADVVARLAAVLDAHPAAAVAGASILLPDGTQNAGANPVHISGLSWSGGLGCPPADGPPAQTLSVSGCAMLVRASVFQELRGFCAEYFMYCDDTDFCWRARLAGHEVWHVPGARVVHDYDFDNGAAKWRHLERNRAWMVLANYRLSTLLALAPLLMGLEAGLLLVAWRQGWLRQKLRANVDVLLGLRRLWAWRRSVQSRRSVGDRALLAMMSPAVTSPLLDSPLVRAANPPLAAYHRVVLSFARLARR